jgi:hypothetical protein
MSEQPSGGIIARRVPFDARDLRYHPGEPLVLDTFRNAFNQEV